MDDETYIKRFTKITLKKACQKVGVDRSNLLSGRVKKEKVKLVREEIESEVAKLYVKNN